MWVVALALHSMAFDIEEDIVVELLEVAEPTWVWLMTLEAADASHRTVAAAEQKAGEDGHRVY